MLVLTWSPDIDLKAMYNVILPLPQPLLKGMVQQFLANLPIATIPNYLS